MLILNKSSIKTVLFLVLFSAGCINLQALNLNQTNKLTDKELKLDNPDSTRSFIFQEQQIHNPDDTIKAKTAPPTETKLADEFTVPSQMANETFVFQINSEISYLKLSHFVLNSSKQIFFQAWSREKELAQISMETDSLRKIYGHSPSEEKEKIASVILKNEEKSVALNQEIPVLFQKARDEEDRYWKSASSEDLLQFRKKIDLYRDSLASINLKKQEQATAQMEAAIDTLVVFEEQMKSQEQKQEASSEIIYKIQIAAYKGKIPEPANKLIKKLSVIRKVENYIDEKGVKVFTTGHLRIYNEAVTLQNQVKLEGAKNAIIAAYQNGKRITVNEARKLNNEL
jgi:hypothetical protein